MEDKFKILLVDDQIENVLLYKKLLEKKNYEIFTANNTKDCFQHIEKEKPHLLVTDNNMSDISGLEILETLKKDERTKNIAIVLITNSELSGKSVQQAFDMGALGYIKRPIGNIEFVARIESFVKHKKAHDRLTNSLIQYDTLFNIIQFSILIVNDKGQIIQTNESTSNLLKYTSIELEKLCLTDLISINQRTDFNDFWKEMLHSGKNQKDFMLLSKNKQIRHTEIKAVANYFNGLNLVVISDYTLRIQLENETLDSYNKYQNLFNGMLDGYALHEMIYDENGRAVDYRFLDINPSFEEMTGLKRDNIIGKTVLEILPETEITWINSYDKVIKTGNPIKLVEYAKSLNKIFNVTAIPNGNKQFATFVMDVTEKVKTENELKEYQTRLEDIVDKRTSDLESKNKKLFESQKAMTFLLEDVIEMKEQLNLLNIKLKNSNAELEAFSYSVSHDLRAPLTRLDGFSKALIDFYSDKIDETGVHYLNRIRNASQAMASLINDMLKLSRISRQKLEIKSINISLIAKSIIEELSIGQASSLKNEILIKPEIMLMCDKKLIQILLDNLISNAWKYSEKNEHRKIEIGQIKMGKQDVIFIKDNGVGFDMKYKDKLFLPFQRLHDDSDFTGTGVGLATVQRIIRAHQGTIWAESKVGEGATFYFHILN